MCDGEIGLLRYLSQRSRKRLIDSKTRDIVISQKARDFSSIVAKLLEGSDVSELSKRSCFMHDPFIVISIKAATSLVASTIGLSLYCLGSVESKP